MRKIFDTLLLLVFLVFIFLYKDQIKNNFQFLLQSPCDTPITYKLGEVDSGYGLTKQQFLTDLSSAGEIWDTVVKKNLFAYDSNGKITVNLIYSDRQAISDNLNQLENKLQGGKVSLQALESEYKNLQADFQEKLKSFNDKVNSFKKNATEDEYNQLLTEQAELKAEADKLNSLAGELNLSVKEYNFAVSQYNQGLGTLQEAITSRPEAGIYNGSIPKIDIYLTSSSAELTHTLAHEFGHALGLAHTTSAQSIMYPLTNEVLAPDAEESQTLSHYCSLRNWEIVAARIKTAVGQKLDQFSQTFLVKKGNG